MRSSPAINTLASNNAANQTPFVVVESEEEEEEEEEETVVIYGRHMEQKQILSEKWADWTRRRE